MKKNFFDKILSFFYKNKKLTNKKLTHNNLSTYLTQQVNNGVISFFHKDHIYNESGKIIKLKWTINFQSTIEYYKKTKDWVVKFIDNLPTDKKMPNSFFTKESFVERKYDYNYDIYGFKLLNSEEDFNNQETNLIITLVSKHLEKIIDFPLYYGFPFGTIII